jgi:predicted S18 family serine protease
MHHMENDSKRVRLTITVMPEVHAAYSRLAEACNMSLGRAMGDWLGETSEAAQAAAEIMERARDAPKEAVRRLNTITATLVAQNEALVDELMAKDKRAARGASVSESHGVREAVTPPSSNTGGKGRRKASGGVR